MRRIILTLIFSISIPPVFNTLHAKPVDNLSALLNIEIEKGHFIAKDPTMFLFNSTNSVLEQTVEMQFFNDVSPQRILVGSALILCSFLIVFLGLLKDRKIS